jgi:hypothetical protein
MAERKAVSREPPRSAQMTVPTERDVETTADEPMTMSSVKSKLPDSVVTLGTAAKSALLSVGPESVVLPSLVLAVVPVSVVSVDVSVLSVVSVFVSVVPEESVEPPEPPVEPVPVPVPAPVPVPEPPPLGAITAVTSINTTARLLDRAPSVTW